MGFGQGLSGLNASSQDLDVIGNNIANSKTVGFKAGTATFADVYANSRVGLGVQTASVNQRFTAGIVATSGNEFDMAIDGPNGLFVVQGPSGEQLYTRNGQFFADKDNNIVNAQGQRLQGFVGGSTSLSGLTVPYGNISPHATSRIDNIVNLNAKSPVIPATDVFDPENSETFSNMTPITVYDSLGNSHQVQQYYVKRDADATNHINNWDVFIAVDGVVIDTSSGAAAMPPYTSASHKLEFNQSGSLVSSSGSYVLNYTVPPTSGTEAAQLNINVEYKGSTQFAGDFSQNFTQDGYETGEYASISISPDGTMVANYTNGATKAVGQLALANFNNLQGLQPMGGNAWAETATSGQPILGAPGSNGLATIKGQAVEESNVDMSEELVNMIIAQRTYQANAQTIKTQDQILQTLITLR